MFIIILFIYGLNGKKGGECDEDFILEVIFYIFFSSDISTIVIIYYVSKLVF